MALGLFRLRLPDGSIRLACGEATSGPSELLAEGLTIEAILGLGEGGLAEALQAHVTGETPPSASVALAPVDTQEVWAAGVTYERSRDARMEESAEASVYDRVYAADRPELFFKAPAWRVRGPGEPIGVRADSEWNVPEPELALVVAADLAIVGFTIGNDVSSRSIEGDNPLYLPQAKSYDGSCALGPALVPVTEATPPFPIRLGVVRDGATIVDETTTSARIRRPLDELVAYLGRALELPSGAILLTGTGIVPGGTFTLLPGDEVRIEAGPLGVLANPVVRVGRSTPGQSLRAADRSASP